MPKTVVAAFLHELRNRFAECSWIDLALRERDGDVELVGEFVPNRDGVLRRHAYRVPSAEMSADPAAALAGPFRRFEQDIRRITRLAR